MKLQSHQLEQQEELGITPLLVLISQVNLFCGTVIPFRWSRHTYLSSTINKYTLFVIYLCCNVTEIMWLEEVLKQQLELSQRQLKTSSLSSFLVFTDIISLAFSLWYDLLSYQTIHNPQ